jgi:hypothetical protein
LKTEIPVLNGIEQGRRKINGKIKVNVKGNGQECPFHTGNRNVNVKNGAVRVRGSHPCAKNAQGWGTLRM